MNHEKENKRIHYSVNLANKRNKTFLSFFSFVFFNFFVDIRRLIKKTHHYTKLYSLLRVYNCLCKSLAKNEKSFLDIKTLTLWWGAQPSLSERSPFFRALHLGIQFSLHPASSRFGTQQQLIHSPVKSSTLSLRKMSVFQGVAPWHTLFTSSCVIPLWDSATAH